MSLNSKKKKNTFVTFNTIFGNIKKNTNFVKKEKQFTFTYIVSDLMIE